MKYLEKVPLTDQEYSDFREACKTFKGRMRQKAAQLIREFLGKEGKE
jgi:hypothetical protein